MVNKHMLIVVIFFFLCIKSGLCQSIQGCYTSDSCTGTEVVEVGITDAKSCCFAASSTSYLDSSGNCAECVVVGWDTSAVTIQEDGVPSSHRIGLSKGGGVLRSVNFGIDIDLGNADSSDFTPPPQLSGIEVFLLAPGFAAMVEFSAIPDSIVESDEVFTLTLVTSTDLSGIGFFRNVLTVTIAGEIASAPAIVEFLSSSVSATESDQSVEFTITLQAPSDESITVLFSTRDASAQDGADYSGVQEVAVVFPPSETQQTVSVAITDDQLIEETEEFVATLTLPDGSTGIALGLSNATAFITDNDNVIIGFSQPLYTTIEGGVVPIMISLNAVSPFPVSVQISTTDITATATDDYEPISQTFTIPAGTVEASLEIEIPTDNVGENEEEFSVTLTSPSANAQLGSDTATVLISDATEVTVEFSSGSYSAIESAGMVSFTLLKTLISERPVSIFFSTSDVTAQAPGDFISASDLIVTFQPSEMERTIEVAIVDDIILESNESFVGVLSLPDGSGGVALGSVTTATATIINDDDVTVGFSQTLYTTFEGAGVTLVVSLRGESSEQVEVEISSVGGSATAGLDYVPSSTSLVIPAGSTVGIFELNITLDNILESEEAFSLALSTATAGVGVENDMTTVLISDTTVQVEFSADAYSGLESGGVITFTVVILGSSAWPLSVLFSTMEGSAQAPADFTSATNLTVTFQPFETEREVEVAIVNDDTVENDESFTSRLSLSDGTVGATLGSVATATATILNDDEAVIEFSQTLYTTFEGGVVTLIFELNAAAAQPVSVEVNTVDATAIGGADFDQISQRVTIPAGSTLAFLEVNITADDIGENEEDFSVTLSSPSANAVLGSATAIVLVSDTTLVRVEFRDEAYSSAESAGVVTFSVVKVDASERPVSVLFSTLQGTAQAPNDFTPISAMPVTFQPSEMERAVQVAIVDDLFLERNESFMGVLAMNEFSDRVVLGSSNSATATIINDDDVMIGFVDTLYTTIEGGLVVVTIQLNAMSFLPVSVEVNTVDESTVAPGDYEPVISRVIEIPAGSTEATIEIPISTDSIGENEEAFRVVLSSPSANTVLGNFEATVLISDATNVRVEFNTSEYDVIEDAAVIGLTLVKLDESDRPVSVLISTNNGSAQAQNDYISVTDLMVTFQPSERLREIEVVIVADSFTEDDENFAVILFLPEGSNGVALGSISSASVTIFDDDIMSTTMAEVETAAPTAEMLTTGSFVTSQSTLSPEPTTEPEETDTATTATTVSTPTTESSTITESVATTQTSTSETLTTEPSAAPETTDVATDSTLTTSSTTTESVATTEATDVATDSTLTTQSSTTTESAATPEATDVATDSTLTTQSSTTTTESVVATTVETPMTDATTSMDEQLVTSEFIAITEAPTTTDDGLLMPESATTDVPLSGSGIVTEEGPLMPGSATTDEPVSGSGVFTQDITESITETPTTDIANETPNDTTSSRTDAEPQFPTTNSAITESTDSLARTDSAVDATDLSTSTDFSSLLDTTTDSSSNCVTSMKLSVLIGAIVALSRFI